MTCKHLPLTSISCMDTSKTVIGISKLVDIIDKRANEKLIEDPNRPIDIVKNLVRMSTTREVPERSEVMATNLKLRSNFARGNFRYGTLLLSFNNEGTCLVPSTDRAEVEKLMAVKPGRFHWVEDQVVVAPVEPEPEEVVPQDTSMNSLEEELKNALEADKEPEKAPEATPDVPEITKRIKRIPAKKIGKK